mgnify:CR=1 FL=1
MNYEQAVQYLERVSRMSSKQLSLDKVRNKHAFNVACIETREDAEKIRETLNVFDAVLVKKSFSGLKSQLQEMRKLRPSLIVIRITAGEYV